jgi:hypothetical protein
MRRRCTLALIGRRHLRRAESRTTKNSRTIPIRSRAGGLLAVIADHIEWLTWSPELRGTSDTAE